MSNIASHRTSKYSIILGAAFLIAAVVAQYFILGIAFFEEYPAIALSLAFLAPIAGSAIGKFIDSKISRDKPESCDMSS